MATTMHVDPTTGRAYYCDSTTGQTWWADEQQQQFVPAVHAGQPGAHDAWPAVQHRAAEMMPLQQPQPVRAFAFDGGAADYLGVCLLAALVTVGTFGICYPWALVMRLRWRARHTLVEGRRLRFTGDAWQLFGQWVKMLLLCLVTLGIYGFWVVPRVTRWAVEHQEFATR